MLFSWPEVCCSQSRRVSKSTRQRIIELCPSNQILNGIAGEEQVDRESVKRDIMEEYRYVGVQRFAGDKLSTKLRDMLVLIEIRYFVAS